LLPCVTEREAVVGAIVKLGVTLTVRLMMVDAVSAPDFPVGDVIGVCTGAAELPAVNVHSTLEPVAGSERRRRNAAGKAARSQSHRTAEFRLRADC